MDIFELISGNLSMLFILTFGLAFMAYEKIKDILSNK